MKKCSLYQVREGRRVKKRTGWKFSFDVNLWWSSRRHWCGGRCLVYNKSEEYKTCQNYTVSIYILNFLILYINLPIWITHILHMSLWKLLFQLVYFQSILSHMVVLIQESQFLLTVHISLQYFGCLPNLSLIVKFKIHYGIQAQIRSVLLIAFMYMYITALQHFTLKDMITSV